MIMAFVVGDGTCGGELASSLEAQDFGCPRQARREFFELHETPAKYTGLTDWRFGELPELMEIPIGGQRVIGYPALRDDGDSASLCVFDTPKEAQAVHAGGLLRLFRLHFREQVKYLEKNMPNGASVPGVRWKRISGPSIIKVSLPLISIIGASKPTVPLDWPSSRRPSGPGRAACRNGPDRQDAQ